MKYLMRIFLAFLLLVILAGGRSFGQAGGYSSNKVADDILGTYEVVSHVIKITKPKNQTIILSEPDWKGLWLINSGHFTSILMKQKRDKFFARIDQDLGFEAFAGTFVLDGEEIKLKQDYSFHPFFVGRPVVMKYRIEGGILTLTQSIKPTLEDMREGQISITLKRIAGSM